MGQVQARQYVRRMEKWTRPVLTSSSVVSSEPLGFPAGSLPSSDSCWRREGTKILFSKCVNGGDVKPFTRINKKYVITLGSYSHKSSENRNITKALKTPPQLSKLTHPDFNCKYSCAISIVHPQLAKAAPSVIMDRWKVFFVTFDSCRLVGGMSVLACSATSCPGLSISAVNRANRIGDS